MKVKPVIVMYCYARSGGTLLNRCISCLPKTLIFSEINSEALCPTKINNLTDQSKSWYHLDIERSSFVKEVKQIEKFCSKSESNFVIRDWSFGSFVPLKYNLFKPTSTLATLRALQQAKIKTKEFAFVRDAKDVWLSMYASGRTFHDRQLNYLYKFTQVIIANKIKIFKYEDFCQKPEQEMRKLCRYLEIPYSKSFLNYTNSFWATGDIDSEKPSRGVEKGQIVLLPRRKVSREILKELEEQTMANKIDELLGYK